MGALFSSTTSPDPTAWVETQLGKLAWTRGRVAEAESHYRTALSVFPGYVYALEQLALVQEAKGRHRAARSLARRAADVLPLPQTVATLGDLYARHGRPRAAHQQYALVDVIQRLLVANGVRTDLEIAQFDADHGVRLGRALAAARNARRARQGKEPLDVDAEVERRLRDLAEG